MTSIEMNINLRLELDKTDALDSVGFENSELDYWLNSANKALVKTKYSGSGLNGGEAFERNQKRIDDLRTLVREEALTVTRSISEDDKPYSYKASLATPIVEDEIDEEYEDPSSLSETYWFTLGEEVDIIYQTGTTPVAVTALSINSVYKVSGSGGLSHAGNPYNDGDYFLATDSTYVSNGGFAYLATTKRCGIVEATTDTYRDKYIDNPYSEHIFENYTAKPLRLFNNTSVELITDGNYGIYKYYIRYLKKPAIIEYGVTDCDLPEHMHDEVVKLAATMILENIESPRYQTSLNEANRIII